MITVRVRVTFHCWLHHNKGKDAEVDVDGEKKKKSEQTRGVNVRLPLIIGKSSAKSKAARQIKRWICSCWTTE